MDEQNTIQEVIEEIRTATDKDLRDTVEKWFTQTRNQGMKVGAAYIAAAVSGVMQKHLKKGKDASLRDYKRMAEDIYKIVSVQLKHNETQQNDSEDDNDGTTEEIG